MKRRSHERLDEPEHDLRADAFEVVNTADADEHRRVGTAAAKGQGSYGQRRFFPAHLTEGLQGGDVTKRPGQAFQIG